MKKGVIITALILVIGLALISYIKLDMSIPNLVNVFENGPLAPKEVLPKEEVVPILDSKLKAANFSGILEEVNVGCFADGECFVVVGGKHVTVLVGRKQEVVGSIKGVGSIGDLENFIGEQMNVYAQNVDNTNYTLYGDENFYIELVDAGALTSRINETVEAVGIKITPLEVLEDSRCPIDVQCIQAGTLRLRAVVETSHGTSEQEFSLGETVTTESTEITLVQVEPISNSSTVINSGDYSFTFKIKNR